MNMVSRSPCVFIFWCMLRLKTDCFDPQLPVLLFHVQTSSQNKYLFQIRQKRCVLSYHLILQIFPPLRAKVFAEFTAGSYMPQALRSELNGHWFKMKSEKRCEVNEFHTPVSLKTQFWLSSHSDWGWHTGNCVMLICTTKSHVAVLHTPHMFEFTEHRCTQVRTLYFSPPLYQFSALDRNSSCHLTQLLLTRILELPGLTLVNTVFFTRTAGQCRLWLYFCCWNWAISRSCDEVWAVWYKLGKVTHRSLLCFTLLSFAPHK